MCRETSSLFEFARQVRESFRGRTRTFAHFGDSITVSMAFWAPLPFERRNTSETLERDFHEVNTYMLPECWGVWKGPSLGNDGGKTTFWALDHISEWLRSLEPETVLILF